MISNQGAQPSWRMAEHVSRETAIRLRSAGLRWTPALGDWVAARDGQWEGVGLVYTAWMTGGLADAVRPLALHIALEGSGLPRLVMAADCVWLATVGNLLGALAAEERWPSLYHYQLAGGRHWSVEVAARQLRTACYSDSSQLVEALAAAYLAAKEAEKRGGANGDERRP